MGVSAGLGFRGWSTLLSASTGPPQGPATIEGPFLETHETPPPLEFNSIGTTISVCTGMTVVGRVRACTHRFYSLMSVHPMRCSDSAWRLSRSYSSAGTNRSNVEGGGRRQRRRNGRGGACKHTPYEGPPLRPVIPVNARGPRGTLRLETQNPNFLRKSKAPFRKVFFYGR